MCGSRWDIPLLVDRGDCPMIGSRWDTPLLVDRGNRPVRVTRRGIPLLAVLSDDVWIMLVFIDRLIGERGR